MNFEMAGKLGRYYLADQYQKKAAIAFRIQIQEESAEKRSMQEKENLHFLQRRAVWQQHSRESY